MRCEIISLARSLGSDGDEVARIVATELGFRYIDHQIVTMAAEKAGVPPDVIERAERSRPFILRILDAMTLSGTAMEGGAIFAVPEGMPPTQTEAREHEAAIQKAIEEIAERRDVVIVGHGASIPLTGHSGLLRVFITASPSVRAERVSRENGIDAGAAWKAIEDSDRDRADYLRRFYDIAAESPVNYDVVINSDILSIQDAVDVLVGIARGRP